MEDPKMMLTGWKAVAIVTVEVVTAGVVVGSSVVNFLNARKIKEMDEKLDRMAKEVIPNYRKEQETQHAASATA
jgi:hypothetical protein